ncbi:MAG: hypothetical protein HYY26_02685 [Acidobacteria bacterium]|nr:hypothetical protein [Acidobacteriota bacterium]
MREVIALIVFCLLMAVLSLGVIGWSLVFGEGLTLDNLLLLSVCLTLALVFGFCALWLAYDAGLLERLRRRAPAAAPANPESKQDKPESGVEKRA